MTETEILGDLLFNPMLTQFIPRDLATMGGARSPMTMKKAIRQPIASVIILSSITSFP